MNKIEEMSTKQKDEIVKKELARREKQKEYHKRRNVRQMLLARKAEEKGMTVSDEEINAHMSK